MKQKFDLIFGIGENCNTSMALRRNNLQIASFPFDWLGFSDLERNFSFLLNDFEGFLEKEDLEKLPNSFNGRTETYVNKKNYLHFVHDFYPDIDFDIQFQKVKDKYLKRQNRLYDKISKSKKVLIVFMSVKESDISSLTEKYQIINEKMNKKFPDTTFSYLYIQNSENNNYDYTDYKLNLEIVTQNRTTEIKECCIFGIRFSLKKFLSSEILKNYKLNMTLKEKFRSFIYFSQKVLINLIPDKNLQTKLRHKNNYN